MSNFKPIFVSAAAALSMAAPPSIAGSSSADLFENDAEALAYCKDLLKKNTAARKRISVENPELAERCSDLILSEYTSTRGSAVGDTMQSDTLMRTDIMRRNTSDIKSNSKAEKAALKAEILDSMTENEKLYFEGLSKRERKAVLQAKIEQRKTGIRGSDIGDTMQSDTLMRSDIRKRE